ncbi:hypothetical protein NFI96_011827, partial [Prochilodus magdalenae]
VLSCQSNCNEVLTSSEGIFTSPCYPSDYPPSQSCAWTLQAPAGFIVQITFLDFELEEAHGCIYDRVIIDNGSGTSNRFCGLTANGLTLNSTGNVMVVSFSSDFSVQKKGFSVSYRQVAVALRNQKVTLPQNSKDVIKVASTVSIPVLSEFTTCFEIARLSQKGTEAIFTYYNASKGIILSFGFTGNTMELNIASAKCSVNDLITQTDLTSQMQPFCLTWSKTNGRVAVNFRGNYRSNICSASVGLTVDAGGSFDLGSEKGGGQSFNGIVYNFRLWDSAMTFSELSTLTCDAVGSVVDWDNNFWDIPASYAHTDPSLSCICYPHCIHLTTAATSRGTSIPYTTPQTTSCSSSGLGCPAPLTTTAPSIVTTNMIPTNATTNALSTTILFTTSPTISLTTTTVVQTTSSFTTTTTTPTTTSITTELLTTTTTTTSMPLTALSTTVSYTTIPSMPLTTTTVQTTSTTTTTPTTTSTTTGKLSVLAPFIFVPAGRSSKTSLGFISTPLIWPIRKKPETAVTRAQKRPTIHLTKPPSLQTKSVANVSPEPKSTSAENKNLTTRRPTYSQVLWSHNHTDDLETFQVASLGNRKNKPLNKPPWTLSDDRNSSETLDYTSGFGPEAFFYDLDLDDDVYSLFDFDSTYSIDESLATIIPLNMSLIEMGSMPAASTHAPDVMSSTVSRQEPLNNQSESTLPWTVAPIPVVSASHGASVEMNLPGLSRLNEQAAESPSFSVLALSPTYLVDSGLMSTVYQGLTEATATKHASVEFEQSQTSHLIKPTMVAHWQMETLKGDYGGTMTTETVYNHTETIPVSTVAASPHDSLPFQTSLFTELLAVSHSPSQSSNPLIAAAQPTPFLRPSFTTEAELLMDSAHSNGTLIEALSSYTSTMLAAEVQSDYIMAETIRPSPLSLSAANDVSMALTPGPAESLFTSGAKDNSDLVVPPSKTQFIPTRIPHTNYSSYLITPSLVIPYLGTEGPVFSSVADQFKLDSPQALEPSHVNRLLETLFRGSNRQKDGNSLEGDLRSPSRTSHISVNSSSESPHTSVATMTDEWGSSPSSPLNSSSQMRAERIDGLPMHSLPSPSSRSVLAAWLGVSKATELGSATETGIFAGEELAPFSTFSVSMASIPPPSLSHSGVLESQIGTSVSQHVKETPSNINRETHPSPPAIDDQAFVPSNGTLPLATPPKGAIAGFDTVPTGATRGTTTDSPELTPCP